MVSDPYKSRRNVLGRECPLLQCHGDFVDDLGPLRESLCSAGMQLLSVSFPLLILYHSDIQTKDDSPV